MYVILSLDMMKQERQRLYYKHYFSYTFNGRLRIAVAQAKRRAAKRGIPFNIDADYVLGLLEQQERKCFYTGIPFTMERTLNCHFNPYTPSLERIVKEKGYTRGNVVLVCQAANMAKGELTYKEYIRFCEAATKNRRDELMEDA